jgi:hypothetical protein
MRCVIFYDVMFRAYIDCSGSSKSSTKFELIDPFFECSTCIPELPSFY